MASNVRQVLIPDRVQNDNISTEIAQNFNGPLEDVKVALPAVIMALPAPRSARYTSSKGRKAGVSFLDSEVLVDRVVGILKLLESGR